MRFMLIVKATGYSEAGVKFSREYDDARRAFKKVLAKAGILLAEEQCQPSSSGIRICYPSNGGEPEIKSGPFAIDQELIAEYTLIDVGTETEAMDWALRMPVPPGFGAFEIELRKLNDETDSIRDPRALALEADLEDQINMLQNIPEGEFKL
ncbi:YciI family protein [Cohnella herbarum]|uniref:YciI family protein n=1 Tax=Cohnella herbarum TaxID=2728023 RepID=A0A7Z2VGZ2_9BACL|nr:YciI family protein [Cohnella herbarum]QJD83021.1 YciI family protein [Cohnella herbarum]